MKTAWIPACAGTTGHIDYFAALPFSGFALKIYE
jgi:hypothetical protein